MSQPAYTLEFPRVTLTVSKTRNPAVTLLSAMIYALAVSVSRSPSALLLASILPAMMLKGFPPRYLARLNVMNAVMILTLALTWPDFSDGFRTGMIIALRVNMICVVLGGMLRPLGTGGMYEALCGLRVPEKLRVLVILTLRGIYTLRERYESAIISVRLRAPGLSGLMRLKVFACMMGMILLQSSARSENMTRAVKCRGGFAGFMQGGNSAMNARDWLCVSGTAVYAVMIAVMNLA